MEPTTESITMEANRVVGGGRRDSYGHPYHNFARTAALWEPILGVKVTPQQVALCLIQLKIARELNKPQRDNAVDIAGYAQCLDLVNNFKPAEASS